MEAGGSALGLAIGSLAHDSSARPPSQRKPQFAEWSPSALAFRWFRTDSATVPAAFHVELPRVGPRQ